MDTNRPFPIQGDEGSPGGWIPWWLAEIAYASYVAEGHGDQSLERLAQRGGFGWIELGRLLSGTYSGNGKCPRRDNREVLAALKAAWAAKPWEVSK